MTQRKRITHQFMQTVGSDPLIRLIVPPLLLIGVFWTAVQVYAHDWLAAAFALIGVVLMVACASFESVQHVLLGQTFNRRHALYIALTWIYAFVWLAQLRLLIHAPFSGKTSAQTYFTLILFIAVSWMLLRSLLILTRPFYKRFVTAIPLWEQIMIAANEATAAGLLATFGANLIVHVFQPHVFTTRFDPVYNGGLGLISLLYYFGIQLMWIQRWNDWLSRSSVWIRLMRVLAPIALIVTTMVIVQHYLNRADPRSANLLGTADLDLAILALAPVIWLLILVSIIIVYTSGRGLRERFLPDLLLDRLPKRLGNFLCTISDTDMLLILGLLATLIPVYLVLFGGTGGVIDQLRAQILQNGSALIETSEQALALLFSIPFYLLIVALLVVYGYALLQPTLSADQRDELVAALPIGFL
ncbi:MAG TPA: hypothetical protein VHD90_26280, partial [Phototrophicaceae bacterium]|nr:hypothetical protein [Phototrophicaceae bacterium]